MRSLTHLLLLIVLMGCGSTPYRDDYTKHVNMITKQPTGETAFTFIFEGGDSVDLRGLYSADDEIGQSAILYQGGAGLAGLIAQIGTHASIVNSNRNDKLALAQKKANVEIQPLIAKVEDISLTILLNDNKASLVSNEKLNTETLRLKPIFFSNSDMSELMLNMVVWIPASKKGRNKYIYKNMIKVYAPKLNEAKPQESIVPGEDTLVKALSTLLNKAVYIALNDVKGAYKKAGLKQKSFFIEQNEKKKVIRGAIVEENCDYQVVRDLHSWFIAFPMESENIPESCTI